ncbi:SRPBCC family protein [Tabrizicola oligotrophica]|uniref:SRPBCC family protein n=1 Tax=Tabrizicola oligotrophica TaxID=2710650 RepID=A0A6M0QSK1_9RHOB|nr:SRPBCC family protein [Tabrizicola oligotrophica]NEY90427.1 SRPBCC family protein [Tabrizicola oligotrophica]
MTGTVRLHRVFACPPAKLYRAFTEADAYATWLPPYGFTATVHRMEARVGGGFHMSFRNFTTGQSHSFGGTYLELVPPARIRHTDRFDDPALPGEMMVTIDLTAVICGTELAIVQEGIPDQIPVAACYLGWQDSLTKLARLVEPDLQG